VKYLFALILLAGFFITPTFAQEEVKNPSVIIETLEIPAEKFNQVLRDAPIVLASDN
jgi:hypothetical protein